MAHFLPPEHVRQVNKLEWPKQDSTVGIGSATGYSIQYHIGYLMGKIIISKKKSIVSYHFKIWNIYNIDLITAILLILK